MSTIITAYHLWNDMQAIYGDFRIMHGTLTNTDGDSRYVWLVEYDTPDWSKPGPEIDLPTELVEGTLQQRQFPTIPGKMSRTQHRVLVGLTDNLPYSTLKSVGYNTIWYRPLFSDCMWQHGSEDMIVRRGTYWQRMWYGPCPKI